MAITVYFVRHGETYFNRFARLQGWSDTPLTEKGKMNAKKIGQVLADLRIDYLFSSDLKRAVDTARLLIADHPTATMKEPIQKEFFREVFYGSFEGHSNEEGAIWASYLEGKRFRRIGELVAELDKALKKRVNMEAVKTVVRKNGDQLNKAMKANAGTAFVKGYSTGDTAGSINTELSDAGMTATVSPTTDYAPYPEFGTRFMAPEPYVRPAFEKQAVQFKKDMKTLTR